MKKNIMIILILLLTISTQTFASQDNNNPNVNQIGQVSNLLTDDNSTEAQQLCWVCTKFITGGGHACTNSNAEASSLDLSSQNSENSPDSDFETNCYVPRYSVCVEGYWATYCRIK